MSKSRYLLFMIVIHCFGALLYAAETGRRVVCQIRPVDGNCALVVLPPVVLKIMRQCQFSNADGQSTISSHGLPAMDTNTSMGWIEQQYVCTRAPYDSQPQPVDIQAWLKDVKHPNESCSGVGCFEQ